jgi:dienelactone hydrolase
MHAETQPWLLWATALAAVGVSIYWMQRLRRVHVDLLADRRAELLRVLNRGRAAFSDPSHFNFVVHRTWAIDFGEGASRPYNQIGTWTHASITMASEPPPPAGFPSQARLPLLIGLPNNLSTTRRTTGPLVPVIIVMHGTSHAKSGAPMKSVMARYAAKGWATISFDLRYHGERSNHSRLSGSGGGVYETSGAWEHELTADERVQTYQAALVAAWRGSGEQPFIYDSAWDLMRLVDWLHEGGGAHALGVDPLRLGATGISLGGMVAWLAAAADPRVAVAAPSLGVQGFQWALDRDSFAARVATLPPVFAAAQADLKATTLDSAVAAAVWDRLLPGIRSVFDAPLSLPLVAPRPLLLVHGARDPRCPIGGVRVAFAAAHAAYSDAGASNAAALFEDAEAAHEVTPKMWAHIDAWFDRHL